MCGRFSLAVDPAELLRLFPDLEVAADFRARYNIAPTEPVLGVRDDHAGHPRLEAFRWGLIPSWAKDAKIGNSLINARADSLDSKPAFRAAFRKRRCLILADGFYEWRPEPGRKEKTPVWVHRQDGGVFAFAGLYEWWRPPDAGDDVPLTLSCTIVTTDAGGLMRPVHDRMPVILPREAYERWLDPDEPDPGRLLQPVGDDALALHPVSSAVNRPGVESPDLVRRADEQLTLENPDER